MAQLREMFLPFLPLLIVVVLVIVVLSLLHFFLLGRRSHLTKEQKLPRQFSLLVLSIIGLVAIAMSLPVSDSIRNQVIALIGVLLSGVIAFSSTTVVGNLMAGLVLRVNRPFRVGDFIRVEGNSGRVTEMGLLDTEIQTETRELISFANTYMVNKPVRVTRASGAIVSVDLSLGYDVHHSEIEKHLLIAAEQAQLSEPFVQVIALGDFSASYRIAGLLTEVKSLLSARSRLHKSVLDALHKAGIEIVSPTFMNQRPQPEGKVMIPDSPTQAQSEELPASTPESLLFDKAEQAESHEQSREFLTAELARIDNLLGSAAGDQKEQFKTKKAQLETRLANLIEKKNQS